MPNSASIKSIVKPPYVMVDWTNPLSNGLAGWWPFHEATGARCADIVKRFDQRATIGDTTHLTWKSARYGVGLTGIAAMTSALTFSNGAVLANSDSWSFDALVKPSAINVLGLIWGPATNNGVFINSTHFALDFSASLTNGTTTLSANQWYHIAVSCNGTNATLYTNGVSDCSPASNGFTPTNMFFDGGSNIYLGTAEYMRYWWKRALTQGEVLRLYNDPYQLAVRVAPINGMSTYKEAFRRPYSPMGTREGSRQLQGWP